MKAPLTACLQVIHKILSKETSACLNTLIFGSLSGKQKVILEAGKDVNEMAEELNYTVGMDLIK